MKRTQKIEIDIISRGCYEALKQCYLSVALGVSEKNSPDFGWCVLKGTLSEAFHWLTRPFVGMIDSWRSILGPVVSQQKSGYELLLFTTRAPRILKKSRVCLVLGEVAFNAAVWFIFCCIASESITACDEPKSRQFCCSHSGHRFPTI